MTACSVADATVERARAEFLEMPGLRLTLRQASRLWQLDPDESACVLGRLADGGFLVQDAAGAYRRTGCPRCC